MRKQPTQYKRVPLVYIRRGLYRTRDDSFSIREELVEIPILWGMWHVHPISDDAKLAFEMANYTGPFHYKDEAVEWLTKCINAWNALEVKP